MSGGGREQGGLDLRSPVRISDFVLAPPTVFADRWQSGGDSDASISRHMAMPAYRPGGGSRSSTTCQRCRGRPLLDVQNLYPILVSVKKYKDFASVLCLHFASQFMHS